MGPENTATDVAVATPARKGDVIWSGLCEYCGQPDCAERFDHARLMAGREQTWRESLRAAA